MNRKLYVLFLYKTHGNIETNTYFCVFTRNCKKKKIMTVFNIFLQENKLKCFI